jgi:hypothetical protein
MDTSEKISLAKNILENPAKWQNTDDYEKFMEYSKNNKLTESYLQNLIETSLNLPAEKKPLKIVPERQLTKLLLNADIFQLGGKKSRKRNKKHKKSKKTKKNKKRYHK